MNDIWLSFKIFLWQMIPTCTALFGIILLSLPIPAPGLQDILPLIPLMCVFYWSLYRPEVFPYWIIFLIGLLQDSLLGTFFGISAFLYLLICAIVARSPRWFRHENFLKHWASFISICVVFFVLMWAVSSLLHGTMPPPLAPAMQCIMTILLYPPIYSGFNRLYTLYTVTLHHAK